MTLIFLVIFIFLRKDNLKDGFGKYFYQNGERYLGQWQKNMKKGAGTMHLFDGSHFKGN